MPPNRIQIASLFVAFAICLGQAFAACPNCDDGLVRHGQVLFPCPLCDGAKGKDAGFPDRKPDTLKDVQVLQSVGHAKKEPTDPHKSVVRITSENNDSVSYGSGVVVMHEGQVLVFTARHVVFDEQPDGSDIEGSKHTVHYQDGTTSPAKVVRHNIPFDFAALEVEKVAAPPLKLAEAKPAMRDKVTIVGFGAHGARMRAATGRVDGRWKPMGQHPHDRFSSSVGARQGDSGGPVFSEAGEVVGILSTSDGSQTWATHCERIRTIVAGDEGNSPNKLDRSTCPNGRCQKR